MEIKWQLFYGVDGWEKEVSALAETPLSLEGVTGESITLTDHLFTGRTPGGEIEKGVFFGEFDLEKEAVLPFGFGGCYFYEVFLNGKSILDRRESGNKPYFPPRPENFTVPAFCVKGKNLLTVVMECGTGEPLRLAFRVRHEYNLRKCTPSVENFAELLNSEKYPAEKTTARYVAEQLIQNGVLMMRNTVFNPFAKAPGLEEEKVRALEKEYPILYFYEKAFDRIKREVPKAVPGEDEVFIWHLYNMGYIIKCTQGCFGIDLCHRRAAELEPFLDFILTTHNHCDHHELPLFKAMALNKKPVVTNFYPAPGFHRPPAELEFNTIKVVTRENDHNKTLQKFVTSYLVTLANGCTIFHAGDTCSAQQLEPGCSPDIYIPHPRVSLKVPEAVAKFRPVTVLYSHFLEMGHTPPTPWFAVPYDLLVEERLEVEKEFGTLTFAPLWGEKLVWNTKEKRFI